MQVAIGVTGQVVVDCKIDAFDINTTTEDIRCYTDALVELFEFLVALDTVVDL